MKSWLPTLLVLIFLVVFFSWNSAKTSISAEELVKENYSQQLVSIRDLANTNPAKAWSLVKEAFIKNGQVIGNAHGLAHIVGHGAYNKFGLEGIKICDQTFAFGCFHGVTEALIEKEGTSTIKQIEVGCLKIFPPEKGQDYTGCIHGTGHGLFSIEGGNLRSALVDCDAISSNYRQYCYDGVFMENAGGDTAKIVLDKNNPWKLCTDLDEKYHRNCARYQSQLFLQNANGKDAVSFVGNECSLAKSTLLRETCFESLGYYVAQNSLGSFDKINISCYKLSGDGRDICLKGAATETTFQMYGDYKTTSDRLCREIALGDRSRDCIQGIINLKR